MKPAAAILLLFLSLFSLGQTGKNVSLKALANFNFATNGLATNEAGAGLGLDASFFSKKKIQLLFELSSDWFFGDKLLVVDNATGKEAKKAAIHSIKAGPQLVLSNKMTIAATYGPAWHVLRDFHFSTDAGFKFSLSGFWGTNNCFATKIFFVTIPTDQQNISYFGVAAGIKF